MRGAKFLCLHASGGPEGLRRPDRGRDKVDGVGSGSDPDRGQGDADRGERWIGVGTAWPGSRREVDRGRDSVPRAEGGAPRGWDTMDEIRDGRVEETGHGGSGDGWRTLRGRPGWTRSGAAMIGGRARMLRDGKGVLLGRAAWIDGDRGLKIAGTGVSTRRSRRLSDRAWSDAPSPREGSRRRIEHDAEAVGHH